MKEQQLVIKEEKHHGKGTKKGNARKSLNLQHLGGNLNYIPLAKHNYNNSLSIQMEARKHHAALKMPAI